MSQSRILSLIEALTNVVVGYALAVATQFAVFPLMAVEMRTRQMLVVGLLFTVVSLARSYALRRLFNRVGKGNEPNARS